MNFNSPNIKRNTVKVFLICATPHAQGYLCIFCAVPLCAANSSSSFNCASIHAVFVSYIQHTTVTTWILFALLAQMYTTRASKFVRYDRHVCTISIVQSDVFIIWPSYLELHTFLAVHFAAYQPFYTRRQFSHNSFSALTS